MFHLEPISTTNIISIVQLFAVVAGFYFSWRTLALGLQNAQAQLYNNMLVQGRDLQRKFMDDLVPEDQKTKFFMGVIIAYYASCFELRRVLHLPESAVKLLDNDVRESMREPPFRQRFEELRNLHSREFGEYVDRLRGVS
ncbi:MULTISPECIES: hypothetical protein [unclassified Bradyrhizobium]|uniref:hypothetical protein n=1 Tax=unclassified Bradyrhizobium TaxID=2631580 RepID=UPI002304454A|nr:hypothetical protein [Bradyrhizobium sp. CCBAU 45321]MDA9545893.1 hypothetical protein [Bradyrhizobium sp. CCBAU 45321]